VLEPSVHQPTYAVALQGTPLQTKIKIATNAVAGNNCQKLGRTARTSLKYFMMEQVYVHNYFATCSVSEEWHGNVSARNPTLAAGGPPTGSSVDMLAHVLGRAVQAAGQLAEYADRARIAGLTCERAYGHRD